MIEGAGLLFEGVRLLLRERRLWLLAAAPVLLAICAVIAATSSLYAYAGLLRAWLTAWLPQVASGAWYTWLWVGPAKLLLLVAGWTLFAVAAALAIALAFLLANVVAAPFLDALSRRVEVLVKGGAASPGTTVASPESGLTALWRESVLAVAAELRRLLFFAALTLAIGAVGLFVPGGQALAPPLLVGVTALFLPLQYAGYALDRRRVPFRDRRRWVVSRWPLMASFGGTAFLSFLVPGLNFLMIPALVVGGTLLVLRHPPDMLADIPAERLG